MEIIEQHGDKPLTIRGLVAVAEKQSWDLDTRLTFTDPETDDELIVRGAACVPGSFGAGDLRIDFHVEHEDEWEVTDDDPIGTRILRDMGAAS